MVYMGEINTDTVNNRVTRRDFIKFIASVAGGALGGKVLYDFGRWWDQENELVTGIVPRSVVESIPDEVPPQLRSKDIPTNNEHFRFADELVRDGLEFYKNMCENNLMLRDAYYQRPEHYLDLPSAVKRFSLRARDNGLENVKENGIWGAFASYAGDLITDVEGPYHNFMTGSQDGFINIESLVANDPGTGVVARIRAKFKEVYGLNYEVYRDCLGYDLPQKEKKNLIYREYHEWFSSALQFVEDKVERNGEKPISTSWLLAHFLSENNGNISYSLWDTMTFLKILSRNDVEILEFAPDRDKAELVCRLFQDEFSPRVSANWVVKNVEPNDQMLHPLDSKAEMKYKTYLPLNRVGLYHGWNEIALACDMSPGLVKRALARHLTKEYSIIGGWGEGSEYGRERVEADLMVLERIDEIASILSNLEINDQVATQSQHP